MLEKCIQLKRKKKALREEWIKAFQTYRNLVAGKNRGKFPTLSRMRFLKILELPWIAPSLRRLQISWRLRRLDFPNDYFRKLRKMENRSQNRLPSALNSYSHAPNIQLLLLLQIVTANTGLIICKLYAVWGLFWSFRPSCSVLRRDGTEWNTDYLQSLLVLQWNVHSFFWSTSTKEYSKTILGRPKCPPVVAPLSFVPSFVKINNYVIFKIKFF